MHFRSLAKVLPAYILCLPLFSASQTFITQGPATDDSTVFWGPGGSTAGAIQPVAPHPTDPNTLYIGGTNGGIWKTTNFGQSWTPLTDHQNSLSMSSIVFDPTDPTANTLLAGIGATSNGVVGNLNGTMNLNFYRGGAPIGILYSTNGGATWENRGLATLINRNVNDVFAQGNFMLAGVFDPTAGADDPSLLGLGNLYKSTDTGSTFTAINVATPAAPAGMEPISAITTPPGNPNTVYVATSRRDDTTLTALFQTTDQGVSFTPLFTAADSGGLINATTQTVLKVATGPSGSIAVGIVDTSIGAPEANEKLVGIFLSLDAGATWNALDLSAVNANCPVMDPLCGFNPTGQGIIDSAIAIDPVDPSIVYAAGTHTNVAPFPLNLWKLQLTDAGTVATDLSQGSNGRTAHPDVRTLIFNGTRLLVSNDGGLDFRTVNANGTWTALNGTTTNTNLSCYESYASAYDANHNRIITAAQDNGITVQNVPVLPLYTALNIGGDGLNAVINDTTSNTTSYYYSSVQELGGLNRVTVAGGVDGQPVFFTTTPDILSGQVVFGSQVVLNKMDPTKIAIGSGEAGMGTVYVTQDDLVGTNLNLTEIGAAIGATPPGPISYGTVADPDAVIVGTGNSNVFFTANASTTDLAATTYLATGGGPPASLVFDTRTSARFYVADGADLYSSTDSGASFTNESPNLPASILRPVSVQFLSNNGVNALFTGGISANGLLSPLVVSDSDGGGTLSNWRLFGIELPNTWINHISYNPKSDTLLTSAFGRGNWLMYDVTSNFPQATVLQFGLANNDSTPDASVLTGTRPLIKYGPGTLTVTGATTFSGPSTVLAGRMNVNGSIPGSVVVNGGATLGGTGTIGGNVTVNGGGNITPGPPIATLTLGSLTLNAGSNTNIEITPTSSSLINVLGAAALAGTVQVVQNGGNYPFTNTYTFLNAASITGSFDPAISLLSGLPGFNFSLLQQPNSVQLTYQRFIALNNITGNASKFGNYINTNGPNSQASQLLSVLSGDTLKKALITAAPTRNGIPIFVTSNNAFTVGQALVTHFSEMHYNRLFPDYVVYYGKSAKNIPQEELTASNDDMTPYCCPAPCEDNAIWIDVFGNFASQDSQKQVPGFNFNTGGVMLGYDTNCGDCWTFGLAAGYVYDHYDEKNSQGKGDINTGFAAPYAIWYCCNFFVEGELLYAYNSIENRRNISFPGYRDTAKSNFHTNQLMPHLGFGFDWCCCNVMIEPFVTFDWVVNWESDFKEHGAAAFNVRQRSRTSSMLRSEIGIRAYRGWDTCYGSLVVRGVLGYVNKAPFDIGRVSASIVGIPSSFTVTAFTRNQNIGTWGISAMLKGQCGLFGMIAYDGEAGDGYFANGIQVKFGKFF